MLHSAVSLAIGTGVMVVPPRLWANAVGGSREISLDRPWRASCGGGGKALYPFLGIPSEIPWTLVQGTTQDEKTLTTVHPMSPF